MNIEDVFQRLGVLSAQLGGLSEDMRSLSRRLEEHVDDDTDKNAKIARELGEISTELKRIGKVEERQWEETSKAGKLEGSDRPRRKSVSDRALLLLIAALIPLAHAVQAVTERAWPAPAPPAASSHP